MINSSDPRLRFDVLTWTPAGVDAPHVDVEAAGAVQELASSDLSWGPSLWRLESRAREVLPGNGLVDYLMASKILACGQTERVLQMLESGNEKNLFFPLSLPCPLGDMGYFMEARRIASFPIYWNLERKRRPGKKPLVIDMLRRIALCAPACNLKLLISVGGTVATGREANRRDFNFFRYGRLLKRSKRLTSVRKMLMDHPPNKAIFGKSPAQIEEMFRETFEEIGGLTDNEYCQLRDGKPIECQGKMRQVLEISERDYQAEYESVCTFLKEIGPLIDEITYSV